MRITTSLFICVCLILLSVISLQAKDWRGIIPLQSTRADVERFLGKPVSEFNGQVEYQMKDYEVWIDYSDGECPKETKDKTPFCAYKMPKDTVTVITLTLFKRISLSEAKIDIIHGI